MKKQPLHLQYSVFSQVQDDAENNPFREAMKGVKPLNQDKISVTAAQKLSDKKQRSGTVNSSSRQKQLDALFTFSDHYEAHLPAVGPVRYCRQGSPTHLLKQLRRGDYTPELLLDLHGLTKEQTKRELAALLYTANKEMVDCVSVMHGHGQGVLKKALPHYLIQHPLVIAFHQAPLEYGGQSALLVLVETQNPTR